MMPTLSPDAVHVWSVPLTAGPERLAALAELLAPDERRRADRFVVARARQQFTAARAALSVLLGRYLGVDPREVRFTTGDTGKPALAGRELFFNVSHTHGLAVYAFTRLGEVGVDVEQVRPYPSHRDLAVRYFTAGEAAAVRGEEAFFAVWTRKEAFLKATGLGLAHGLERFEVSVPPDDPPRILHIDGDAAAGAAWSLLSLTPAPGYVAALAIEGSVPRVEVRGWGE